MRTAMLLVGVAIILAAHPADEVRRAEARPHQARDGGGPLFASAPGSPIPVGLGSGTILLADVDGNGPLDMITRHLLTRLVTVQLGNGQGGFTAAPPGPIAFAYPPGDIVAGDLNKDGRLDLAVTPSDRDVVEVLLGNGRGAFSKTPASPHTVSTSVQPYNKRTLQILDLNEDGNLDLVTANGRRQNTFGVLFGDGRGAFAAGPIVTLDSGRDGYAFAFGDLDGNGHLDVVSVSRGGMGADTGPGRVIVQSGDGRGGFSPTPRSPLSVATAPRTVGVADVNGDTRLDIVIGHGRLVSVLLNAGDFEFDMAPGSPFNLGAEAFALSVADVNRDRKLDLVAATANSVTVLLGDGAAFVAASGSPFRAGPGAYNVGLGDVNGDGKLDVAAASFEGKAVTLLLGK